MELRKKIAVVPILILLLSISATSFAALELNRSFSTGLFSGKKDAPKEIFSFKFKNASEQKIENLAVEISGPLMAETVKTDAGSVDAGGDAFAKVKLTALPRGGAGAAEFHIKATADGKVYEWDTKVERIPPDWQRIHILTHFHYDPVWINKDGQRGYALSALSLVNQYINACAADPTYSFVIEQVPYLKPFWDTYPEHRATLWKLMDRGQLELVGGGYDQPDESSVFGEGLIRNYQYGRLFEEDVMKGRVTAGWQIDNFGHTPQLPQILAKSGLNSFTFLRGGPIGLPREFFWMSADGTEIFSLDLGVKDEIAKVFEGRVKVDKKEDVNMDLVESLEREALPDLISTLRSAFSVHSFFLPLGDDFMPPMPIIGTLTRYWNGRYTYPAMRFSLPTPYFKDAANDVANNSINQRYTTKDLNPVFKGCYSSRTDLKIANRKAEMSYLDAEALATVANLLGADYPARAMDKSIRELLYNEHHDSIPGTTNELSYLDILYAWRESLRLSADVRARSLDYISGKIDTSGADGLLPLVVTNTLSFKRADAVEIKSDRPVSELKTAGGTQVDFDQWKNGDGYVLRFTAADVPSMGYKVYYATPAAEKNLNDTVSAEDTSKIGNEYFDVEVDASRGGGIVSLTDKKTGRAWAADNGSSLMNTLFIQNDAGDLWDLRLSGGYSTASAQAKVTVQRGKTFSTIIAESNHPDFSIRQTITLQNGVPLVSFETRVFDFKGENKLFKLVFPVSAYEGLTPVYDERFTPIVRKRGEEFPADQWAGLSTAFALRAPDGAMPLGVPAIVVHRDDKEAQVFAKNLALALDRIGTPSVTFFDEALPDPTTDSAIYIGAPESFPPLVSKLGAGMNDTLHIVNRGGMAVIGEKDRPVWMIGAKMYATEGASADFLAGIVKTKVVDMPAEMFVSGVPAKKAAAGTFALIDVGSNGYLFTEDGTVQMQLLRSVTGRPGGEAYERAFSKEDWNHSFSYAVAAGNGDWEELEVEAAGLSANHPLLAVWTGVHEGALPADSLSFFSIEPKGTYISAVKKFDNSIPSYSRNKKYEGTMLRVYSDMPEESGVKVHSYFAFKSASLTDMQGNNAEKLASDGKTISAKLGGRSIDTFILGTTPAKPDGTKLGAEVETVQPIYASYWRQNDNVSGLGYQPLTVSFDPVLLEPGKGEVKLKIASDYTDTSVSGVVTIEAPEGWKVEPATVEYNIEPYGYAIAQLKVTAPAADSTGLIRAFYENEGQKYYTSLAVGRSPIPKAKGPSEIAIRAGESKTVKMTLTNDFPQPISGDAVVISSIGSWSEDPGTLQVGIAPFRAPFSIPAAGESAFEVNLSAKANALPGSFWFVLKLMANGEYVLSNPVEVTIRP
jgi:alpha-mannosidase